MDIIGTLMAKQRATRKVSAPSKPSRPASTIDSFMAKPSNVNVVATGNKNTASLNDILSVQKKSAPKVDVKPATKEKRSSVVDSIIAKQHEVMNHRANASRSTPIKVLTDAEEKQIREEFKAFIAEVDAMAKKLRMENEAKVSETLAELKVDPAPTVKEEPAVEDVATVEVEAVMAPVTETLVTGISVGSEETGDEQVIVVKPKKSRRKAEPAVSETSLTEDVKAE